MLPLKGQAKHLFQGYLLVSDISWPVGALTPICTCYSPSVTISVCKFPLFIRIPVIWISNPPYSRMTLPSLFHLQWPCSPCFQIRSHFEIHFVYFQHTNFKGDTIQPKSKPQESTESEGSGEKLSDIFLFLFFFVSGNWCVPVDLLERCI